MTRTLLALAVLAPAACVTGGSSGKVDEEKIAGDIACEMCGLVAEDLWTSLVSDWAAKTQRGERARAHGASRTAREMLEQFCSESSPILGHFVDMYDIQPCDQELPLAKQPGCSQQPGQKQQQHQWYIKRDVLPPPTLPSSKQVGEEYEAALQEAIGAAFKDDRPLAAALGTALGGKGVVDQDALNELVDAASGEEGLDSEEKEQFQAVLQAAIAKRSALSQSPASPPRAKSAAERTWHLATYKRVCAGYLRAIEVDFTEAIDARFKEQPHLFTELAELAAADSALHETVEKKIDAVVDGGKLAVRTDACTDVCEITGLDGGQGRKNKRAKKKKNKKKNKKDEKVARKQSEL